MVDKDHYNFDGLCIAPDRYRRTKCSWSALESFELDEEQSECIYYDYRDARCLKKIDDKESED